MLNQFCLHPNPWNLYALDILWLLGIYAGKIAEMVRYSTNDKKLKNASRGIFNVIHKLGKTLPVSLSSIMVPVRGKSRQKHIERIRQWPILFLSDWVKTAFQEPYFGFFYLEGTPRTS